jgi:hypothetical protein
MTLICHALVSRVNKKCQAQNFLLKKLTHAGIGGDILYYLTWQSQPGMQFGQHARLLAKKSFEVRSRQRLGNIHLLNKSKLIN